MAQDPSEERIVRQMVRVLLERPGEWVTFRSNLHQLASPPLARTKSGPQISHLDPYPCELQPFFRITACSMSLSRLRSATSFFSRRFSSSNCRSR